MAVIQTHLNLDPWQKIQHITKVFNYSSINSLGRALGIDQCSQDYLYNIKRGERISERLADMIVALHPEVPREWLLAGGDNIEAHKSKNHIYILAQMNLNREQAYQIYSTLRELFEEDTKIVNR